MALLKLTRAHDDRPFYVFENEVGSLDWTTAYTLWPPDPVVVAATEQYMNVPLIDSFDELVRLNNYLDIKAKWDVESKMFQEHIINK